MKRILCVILACLVTVLAGVPAIASGIMKSDADAILATVSTNVAATEEISANVAAIIAWQLDGSKEQLAAYEEAVKNGEDIPNDDNYDEVVAKADELDLYINRIVMLRADIDALEHTGLTSIDRTIDAAKTYFASFEGALRDLMTIFDFFFAEQSAGEAMTTYDESSYEDSAAAIEALYLAIQDMTGAMDAIDCPAFMEECFDKYIATMRKYLAVLETMYTALQISDVLRSTSATYLIGRMTIEVARSEVELTELFNLQYEKVGERLAGNIATLRSELIANCAALRAAL